MNKKKKKKKLIILSTFEVIVNYKDKRIFNHISNDKNIKILISKNKIKITEYKDNILYILHNIDYSINIICTKCIYDNIDENIRLLNIDIME